MLKQLRIKFVCVTMLVVTLMLCIICGLILNSTSRRLEIQSLQLMQDPALLPRRGRQPNAPPTFEGDARIPFFVVDLHTDGTIRETFSDYYDLSDEQFLQEIVALAESSAGTNGKLEDYSLRYNRISMPKGETIVFMDTSGEEMMMRSLLKNCTLVGSAAWLAFLGISLLLARWMFRPVEQAWEQQKQFVADASHELKTPLTVILTNAELLQDPDYTEQDRTQFGRNILTMTRQMRDLTENLLDLARADNGRIGESMTDLDLTMLVSEALLPFEPLCFEKGLTLESSLPTAPLPMHGSPQHLRQVTEILLDNAAKYSSSPAVVRVELSHRSDHALLTISNPSDELSRTDLQNIFKRFYRLDKARTERQSYGLGLSIAEAIVREHHGRIWADWKDGRITFSVRLPL